MAKNKQMVDKSQYEPGLDNTKEKTGNKILHQMPCHEEWKN